MMSHYTSLCWSAVQDRMPVRAVAQSQRQLSWNESALEVLEDFTLHTPLHVHTSTGLKYADAVMDGAASRYACVLDHNEELVGVVAMRDLHGRQAVRLARELEVPHDEISVEYLMKPVAQLPLVTRKQLESALIGDVVATMQKSGKDFLLVHEKGRIVGLISSLGIVERTGESVQVRHHAESFAEILHAIKHMDDVE